jgi:hypothetical protein
VRKSAGWSACLTVGYGSSILVPEMVVRPTYPFWTYGMGCGEGNEEEELWFLLEPA